MLIVRTLLIEYFNSKNTNLNGLVANQRGSFNIKNTLIEYDHFNQKESW